jgi:hypothetical protein
MSDKAALNGYEVFDLFGNDKHWMGWSQQGREERVLGPREAG